MVKDNNVTLQDKYIPFQENTAKVLVCYQDAQFYLRYS